MRASKSLLLAAKIYAYINGDKAVLPEHIEAISTSVLRHRTQLSYAGVKEFETPENLISEIIKTTRWIYE